MAAAGVEAGEPHVHLAPEMPYLDLTFPVPFRLWEPTTVVTDLMLSAAFIWAALALPTAKRPSAATLRRLWFGFFFVVGISPICGAIVHGFDLVVGWVWKINLICVAYGTWSMETLSLHWLTRGRRAWWHAPMRLLFTAQLLYTAYYIVFVSAKFIVIILNYAPTQLVNTALHLAAGCCTSRMTEFDRQHAAASRGLLGSMVVMLLAAVLQATGLAPHKWFNHNDLYHVVQIYSTYLTYRGASEAIKVMETAPAGEERPSKKDK